MTSGIFRHLQAMDTVDAGHQKNWPKLSHGSSEPESAPHRSDHLSFQGRQMAGSGWFPSQIARKLLYLRGRTFSLKFCRKKQAVTKHSEALASAFGCLHLCLASNNNCAKRNWLLDLIPWYFCLNNNIIIILTTTTIMENRTKASTNQQLHCYHQQGSKVPGSAQWAPRLSRPNEAVTCTSEQRPHTCA